MLQTASRLLPLASACLFIAACAGGSFAPPISPADLSRVSAASKQLRLYVADEQKNAILVFDVPGLKPVATITDSVKKPQGIALGEDGTLYVANSGNDTIAAYPGGATKPSSIVSDGIHNPVGLAVDKYDNVYYTDSSGSVSEIIKGHTSAQLFASGLAKPIGVAAAPYGLAAESELYVIEGKTGEVVLLVPTGKPRVVQTPGAGSYDIAYTSSGNLYIGTSHAPAGVYVYSKPTAKTPTEIRAAGVTKPTFFAVASSREVFVADPASKKVFELEVGETKPIASIASFDFPTGIAVGAVTVEPTPTPSSKPSPGATPTLPPTPTPGPLTVNPKTLTFASARAQTFVASESKYSGSFSAISSAKNIASVRPGHATGPRATFTVTPLAYGNVTIDIRDKNGNAAALTVVVNNAGIVVNRAYAQPTPGGR
jgi:hypothetical protein